MDGFSISTVPWPLQPSDLADPADPIHTSKAIQQFGENAEVGGGFTLKDFPYAHIPPEIAKDATIQDVANVCC